MFSPKKKLETPEKFEFPFEPYKIQSDLMKSLYSVLENKKIGIFESPTGTGKSLTLVSSSIRWLFDHKDLLKNEIKEDIKNIEEEIQSLDNSNVKDWIESQSKALQKKYELAKLVKINGSIIEHDKKMASLRNKTKYKENSSITANLDQTEISFAGESKDDSDFDDTLNDEKEVQNDDFSDIKIFFCSRTHSQLSQVVREIKKTSFGRLVRCVMMGSRKHLCINHEVLKLNSIHLMNERCLEMQKSTRSKNTETQQSPPKKKSRTSNFTKCRFKTKSLVENLKDHSLAEIQDIEDLVLEGKKQKACPYYSSRLALKDAQVVMLPYQMLFHRSTRTQSGITLKNNIVIIDEAHNLIDTISNIYSADLDIKQLQSALIQLNMYKEKYFNRFSTQNLLKINQIIFIVKRLIKIICKESKIKSEMVKTHELMSEGEFYNIDLFELLRFCENTHFAEKVHNFSQRFEKNENFTASKIEVKSENKFNGIKGLLKKLEVVKVPVQNCNESNQIFESNQIQNNVKNVIRPLLKFLECLTECADDGGIIIKYKLDKSTITPGMKFLLLNPSGHFKDIIEESRSLIIAGGTMQPINELTNQLFKDCIDRVLIHIYDHIVPANSILPIAITRGPTMKKFSFNLQNRTNSEQLKELAQTFFNICCIVPAGIVCFVPSYEYLEFLWSYLDSNKCLTCLESKKFLFRESQSSKNNESVEKLLKQYSFSIKDKSRNGAFIFCVIGGKLSEGLNFSDDLGRCVVVVGLPYPNKTSLELQEKIKYLNETIGSNYGNEYYENICMKAVNQCIGRSIRHIKDYATVLLIDERYVLNKIKRKLPGWISRNLYVPENYGHVQKSIVNFFKEKNMQNL